MADYDPRHFLPTVEVEESRRHVATPCSLHGDFDPVQAPTPEHVGNERAEPDQSHHLHPSASGLRGQPQGHNPTVVLDLHATLTLTLGIGHGSIEPGGPPGGMTIGQPASGRGITVNTAPRRLPSNTSCP